MFLFEAVVKTFISLSLLFASCCVLLYSTTLQPPTQQIRNNLITITARKIFCSTFDTCFDPAGYGFMTSDQYQATIVVDLLLLSQNKRIFHKMNATGHYLILCAAAPQLKGLVAGFPQRRPGFNPRSGKVGFVVDKVALRQVFSEYFGFPCHSFHQILHPHNHPGQVQ
jgi:hypothetical protein